MAQQILRPLGQTALTLLFLVRGSAAGEGEGLFSLELLHPELAEDEGLRSSFLEEAALATQLGHPNLVGTRAVLSGENGYGRTTEWCEGQPLSRVLERVGRGSFPLRLQVWIHCQLLAALSHGHHFFEHPGGPDGLLHGSISPESVLLGYDGQVRLLGMGFPRTRAALERRRGQLLIESCYAAPERYVGSTPAPSEDLYAVGTLLWEAVTEMHRGLASSLVDVLQPRPSDETPSAAELCPEAPQSLTRICERALGARPSERYPDALGMRAELEAFLAETSSADELEPGPAMLAEFMERHFAAERIDLESQSESSRAERAAEPLSAPANDVAPVHLLRFTADAGDERTHTVTRFDEPIPTELPSVAAAEVIDSARAGSALGGLGLVASEQVDSERFVSEQIESERFVSEQIESERVASERVASGVDDSGLSAAEPGGSEPRRVEPVVTRPQLAITQALDPEVIIAGWRARQELKRRRLGVSSRSPSFRSPSSREAWRVAGTVLGVAGILILFAIARYGVPGARGLRNAAPPPSSAGTPSPGSEAATPSVRSALLPSVPPAATAAARRSTEPIASSLTAPVDDAPPSAPVAPGAAARSPAKAGRTSAPAEDSAEHFHPRYLRAEDVAQLREIDDSTTAPHLQPESNVRRQPNWKTRFEKILRSATPAGSATHEPRRIDEEDPYSP